jgi:hypothetical protein
MGNPSRTTDKTISVSLRDAPPLSPFGASSRLPVQKIEEPPQNIVTRKRTVPDKYFLDRETLFSPEARAGQGADPHRVETL